jgi:hypothetical protein
MYQLTATACIIRLADGACIPPDPANRDYADYLTWVAAGNAAHPAPGPSLQSLIDAQWSRADALVRAALDDNARARYLAWLIDGNPTQKQMVRDVQAWADGIWQSYAVAKAAIEAGDATATVLDPPACPHDFWAIAAAT